MKINYEICGSGDHTIVWVHGFCGDLNIWKKSIPNFKNYKNLLFDYYGHGESPKDVLPEEAISITIQDIRQVVTKESVGNIFWIGHSFGGNMTPKLSNYFDQSAGLIFVDCSCYLSENTQRIDVGMGKNISLPLSSLRERES